MNLNKLIKTGLFLGGLMVIGFQMACGEPLEKVVTADDQFVIDIEEIEHYLSVNGIVDYDTVSFTFNFNGSRLYSEIRTTVLDEGTGESIEYGDFIQFDYIGRFTDDLIFDSSIPELAFAQDTAYTDSLVFELDEDDNYVLDINGFPAVEYVEYKEDYFPAYRYLRDYSQSGTTHTPGGWFILQEANTVAGFNQGVHYALQHVNLGGRTIMFLPSNSGSNLFGLGDMVTSFEIRPVRKR